VSFTVKVDAAKAITAGKAEKNSISKTVSFKVQHATQYHVSVNGSLVQTYEFENEGEHTIELNLVESKNTIVIDAGCKGQVGFDVIFNEIHVYPNPTSDIATISGLYSDEVAVKVFDLRGSLVFQKNMKVHNNQIELSYAKIPVGMYIVKVQGELEETNFKIIKK
jgi:hypothetical protein